jgi:hypothetical protein
MYTNRYQSPFQAFCLIHLSDTLLREAKPKGPEVIQFGLEALREALPGFLFVGPLQAMFCQAAQECGYSLPHNVDELMGGRMQYGPEEFLDTCERMSYTQPVDLLLDRLDPSVTENFDEAWTAFIDGREAGERPSSAASGRGSEGQPSPQGSPGNRALQIQELVNP